MSVIIIDVPGVGPVAFYKRRGTRNMRITLSPQGNIKVSMPAWAPYRLAIDFVKRKEPWVQEHRAVPQLLKNGQTIGKAHHIVFATNNNTTKAKNRLTGNTIHVMHSPELTEADASVQGSAQRGALKALQLEAEALLPQRLQNLARQHNLTYSNVRIKHLRSKWGSCSHEKEITLNSYLMTLPWDLIDYVLVHELVHTKVLRHGKPFWGEMEKQLVDAQALRKRLRNHQPTFHTV